MYLQQADCLYSFGEIELCHFFHKSVFVSTFFSLLLNAGTPGRVILTHEKRLQISPSDSDITTIEDRQNHGVVQETGKGARSIVSRHSNQVDGIYRRLYRSIRAVDLGLNGKFVSLSRCQGLCSFPSKISATSLVECRSSLCHVTHLEVSVRILISMSRSATL